MGKKKSGKKSGSKSKDAARKAKELAAANPTEEAKAKAIEHKTLGNTAFANKDYETAVRGRVWSRAVRLVRVLIDCARLPSSAAPSPWIALWPSTSPTALPPSLGTQPPMTTPSCCAAPPHTFTLLRVLSLRKPKKAIADAQKCVELEPTWGKGFSRLGAAFYAAGKYQKAVQAYAQGLTVEPSLATLATGLAQAQAAIAAKSHTTATPPAGGAGGAGAGAGAGSDDDEDGMTATQRILKQRAADKAAGGAPGGEAEGKDPTEVDDIIGIDLGTTYSCVGVWRNDRVELVPMPDGNMTMASCVAFTDEERIIGNAAKQQATANAKNTVYDAKRLIGQRYSDDVVQRDIRSFPFNVVDDNDKPLIEIELRGEKKQFAPEQISAMVLGKLKQTAEQFMGKKVRPHWVAWLPRC